MEIETAKVWLQVINMFGTFALGVWLYLEKRSDKTNEDVKKLKEKVDQIDKDVTGLTACSERAPNHTDLSNVYKSINDLAETVNQLVGVNQVQTDTLRLIQNLIMQKGMG